MESALGSLTFRRLFPVRGGSVMGTIPVVFPIAGESPLAPSESTAAALRVEGAADGSRDGAVTAGRRSAAGRWDDRVNQLHGSTSNREKSNHQSTGPNLQR